VKTQAKFAVAVILLAVTALFLHARSRNEVLPPREPLAGFPRQLLAGDYWSTIIAISAIEQQFCRIRPSSSPFNCWGMMRSSGGLKRYASFDEAVAAVETWLVNHEAGHPTTESLNCFYVQPCSANWLNTVLRVKSELESL